MASAPLVFACLVVSVYDGDTFSCDGRKESVRLWGAAAPERSPVEPGGKQAEEWMREYLLDAELTCVRKGTSRKRVTAQCFREGRDIAFDLVASGNALDCPGFSGGLYVPAEKMAREAGRWQELPFHSYCYPKAR